MGEGHKVMLARKRRWRVRSRVKGTAERPRLSVHFSNRHIYAQCIDDRCGRTLVAASSLSQEVQAGGEKPLRANVSGARVLGKLLARRALDLGLAAVVFDRGPRCYHGCVEAFADAAREAGLEF
jgi:large subunit ribosomal protein L18